MTRTHTPGPWTRRHGQHVYAGASASGAGRLLFAAAPNSGTREELDESFANARLVAAAPELLRVMKDLVSMYERGYVAGVSDRTGSAFLDSVLSARSIIAKAEGGA